MMLVEGSRSLLFTFIGLTWDTPFATYWLVEFEGTAWHPWHTAEASSMSIDCFHRIAIPHWGDWSSSMGWTCLRHLLDLGHGLRRIRKTRERGENGSTQGSGCCGSLVGDVVIVWLVVGWSVLFLGVLPMCQRKQHFGYLEMFPAKAVFRWVRPFAICWWRRQSRSTITRWSMRTSQMAHQNITRNTKKPSFQTVVGMTWLGISLTRSMVTPIWTKSSTTQQYRSTCKARILWTTSIQSSGTNEPSETNWS